MQSGWPSPRLLLDDPHSVESLSDLYLFKRFVSFDRMFDSMYHG